MRMVPIPREFILHVERGADALRSRADEIEKSVQNDVSIDPKGSVATACAHGAETDRQTADLLDGWALRQREAIGFPRP